MAQPDAEVKEIRDPETGRRFFIVVWVQRCRSWIDKHPRTGWYVGFLLIVNTILNIVDLFH